MVSSGNPYILAPNGVDLSLKTLVRLECRTSSDTSQSMDFLGKSIHSRSPSGYGSNPKNAYSREWQIHGQRTANLQHTVARACAKKNKLVNTTARRLSQNAAIYRTSESGVQKPFKKRTSGDGTLVFWFRHHRTPTPQTPPDTRCSNNPTTPPRHRQ